MRLKAFGSCHSRGVYAIGFRYVDDNDKHITGTPVIEVPADSFEHMRDVIAAYNQASDEGVAIPRA